MASSNFDWTFWPIVKLITCFTIIVISTIGNFLVLIAVWIHKQILTTHANYFLINLAIADFLVSAAVMPFAAIMAAQGSAWHYGENYCFVWVMLDIWCCSASILSLGAISIDRYIGVTRPLLYPILMTKKRAIILILLVWILSFTYSVVPLIIWADEVNYGTNELATCSSNHNLLHMLIIAVADFYIPIVIILIFYWRIYKVVQRYKFRLATGVMIDGSSSNSDKNSDGNGNEILRIHAGGYKNNGKSVSDSTIKNQKTSSNLTASKFHKQKKVAIQLGIVVGAFLICWLPFFTVLPLLNIIHVPSAVVTIFLWLGYLNSCLNPFIYIASSKEFKIAFKKMCSLIREKRPTKMGGVALVK